MIITHTEKPKFCRRCGRHIDDAIREQSGMMHPCDDGQCTFREEIARALEKRKHAPFTITVVQPKFRITETYKKFTIN